MANSKPEKLAEEQAAIHAAKYDKAILIENAGQMGTTPELMAGALASVKPDALTKQEAGDALKAYLTRPVNPKKGSEK